MKLLLLSAFTVISLRSYSQDKKQSIDHKIQTVFEKKTFFHDKLLINKLSKIIEFGPYQVPIDEVRVVYQYDDQLTLDRRHYVRFLCSSNQYCIIGQSGSPTAVAVAVPFESKEGCYEFMNLLKDLKDSLK